MKLRRKVLKRRGGFTLVETIAAVAIMTLLMIAVGRVSMIKLADQRSLDSQYDIIAADAFFAEIYEDFHNCVQFTVEDTPSGNTLLTFHMLDGKSDVFGFYPDSGDCRVNGVHMFDAQTMIVQGAGNSLVVSIKLPTERILDMSIFR